MTKVILALTLFLSGCGGKTFIDGYNLAQKENEILVAQLIDINQTLANQNDNYRNSLDECLDNQVEIIEAPCK